MSTEIEVDSRMPDRAGWLAIFATRTVLGLLWVQNVGWKTPPDFGRSAEFGAAAGRFWGLDEILRPRWKNSDSRLARLLLKAS